MNRLFTWQDQERFAQLSGDYNPIHVDALAARRLLFGRPVVHGVHVLLWALDGWLQRHGVPICLSRVKAAFGSPVFLDEAVELVVTAVGAARVRLDVVKDGVNLMQATVEWCEGTESAALPDQTLPERLPCKAWTAANIQHAHGELPMVLNPALASELFPSASWLIQHRQLAAMLALTRMVGMELPGENSLFVGLTLDASDASAASSSLRYSTAEFDDRLSLVTIQVSGSGLQGEVKAALRPLPVHQPEFVEIARDVTPGEFHGERALVIGGSRGVGDVAVKMLAAGGAEVKFTYRKGIKEAREIVADAAAGGSAVSCFSYDVATDGPKLAETLGAWSPTLLCYFATPFAFSSVTGRFSLTLYQGFSRAFIDGFLETFAAVSRPGCSLRSVLYPSSISIDELPATMGEYAVAKSAAETLCRFLAKRHRRIRFHFPRLPRLATDQTVSLLAVDNAEPRTVVLGMLRAACLSAPKKEKAL